MLSLFIIQNKTIFFFLRIYFYFVARYLFVRTILYLIYDGYITLHTVVKFICRYNLDTEEKII